MSRSLCFGRRALLLLGVALQANVAPVLASRAQQGRVANGLRNLVKCRAAMRLLGRAYLWGQAPRPTVEDLVHEVAGDDFVEPSSSLAPLDGPLRRALRRRVRRNMEADYRNARMVGVSGWLVSETEARLAAIVALEDPRPGSQRSVRRP